MARIPDRTIIDTQMRLQALGYDPKWVDGLWGPASEAAFQKMYAELRKEYTAWGTKFTPEELRVLQAVLKDGKFAGGIDESDMMSCMAFETGTTFDPKIQNKVSGACVDVDTEILTQTGWKKYNEVKVGDLVYSVDYENGEKLKLTEIQKVNIIESDDNYRMTSRSFSSFSTHNHRWYLKYRMYQSRSNKRFELRVKTTEEMVNLASPAHHFIPHVDKSIIDTETVLNDNSHYLYRLLGLIASDGSINKKTGIVELNCHLFNDYEYEMIVECIDELFDSNVNVRELDSNMLRWNFNSEQSKELIKFFDVSWNDSLDQSRFIKKLNPEVFKTLDYDSASNLVLGYLSGDGHFSTSNNTVSFRNTEMSIIDDFMMAAVLAGENPRMVSDLREGTSARMPDGRICIQKDIHTVYLRMAHRTSCSNKQLMIVPDKTMRTMWCPTVKYGTWIARREGTVYITGNSGLIQFMPAIARAYGTSTDELMKMSVSEQLHYVGVHFKPYAKRLRNLGDVYMSILWPRAVGMEDDYVLWSVGTTAYKQNQGLDLNKDGKITREECLHKIKNMMVRGFDPAVRRARSEWVLPAKKKK